MLDIHMLLVLGVFCNAIALIIFLATVSYQKLALFAQLILLQRLIIVCKHVFVKTATRLYYLVCHFFVAAPKIIIVMVTLRKLALHAKMAPSLQIITQLPARAIQALVLRQWV